MIREGVPPPVKLVIDGEIHRFRIDSSRDAGWYVVYPDGWPAGAFGNWKTGLHMTWHAEHSSPLSLAQDAARRRNLERAKADRDAQRAKKAEIAQNAVADIWEHAGLASEDHKYLKAKRIQPHGARITGDGRLIIPMFCEGHLSSVQYIDDQGSKLYHPGGAVRGAFFELGSREAPDRVFFAEGFATAASIAEATDQMTVVCFSAQNIPAVVAQFRLRFPTTSFVIAADNDASGTGVNYANQAAAASGAQVAVPPNVGEDFNDLAAGGEDITAILQIQPKPWLVPIHEFVATPEPVRWLVKGWVQQNALMMVHGPSGSGKTFLVLDWALSMLCDKSWMGCKTKQAGFVYLAGEGHKGLRKRFAGWLAYHGQDPAGLPASISTSGTDLDTPAGLTKVCEAIRSMEVRPALVIVDTLHRFLAGDENKAQDTRAMLASCAAIMEEFGCSVLLVHHTGNAENAQTRARGSSAWRGALDIEVSVTKKEGKSIQVLCTKSKDDEEPSPVFIQLERINVPFWFDEDGNPETTAVVIKGEKPLTKQDNNLASGKDAFRFAWETCGKERLEGAPYLSRQGWKGVLMEHEGIKESAANKMLQPSELRNPVFMRCLVEENMIIREGDGFIAVNQFALFLNGQTDN